MFQHYPMTKLSDFCMVQDVAMFGVGFQQRKLKLAMSESMKWSEVHSHRYSFHNMFKLQRLSTKWLLVENAVKVHVKLRILFVHFPPNVIYIKHILFPVILVGPSVLTPFSSVQGNSHIAVFLVLLL
jgi:hypothetical protein